MSFWRASCSTHARSSRRRDRQEGLFEWPTAAPSSSTRSAHHAGDEIKLLRVLQERRIRRVGGTDEIEVNVRVLAATNQDLEQLVRQNDSARSVLPHQRHPDPHAGLREKPEDIPKLALHFLVKYGRVMAEDHPHQRGGHAPPGGSRLAGNVRELENVIERAVALEATDAITPTAVARVRSGGRPAPEFAIVLSDGGIDLERQLERLREHYMEEALRRAQGSRPGRRDPRMSFRSFRYFAKKYRLTIARKRGRTSDSRGPPGAVRTSRAPVPRSHDRLQEAGAGHAIRGKMARGSAP